MKKGVLFFAAALAAWLTLGLYEWIMSFVPIWAVVICIIAISSVSLAWCFEKLNNGNR